MCNRFRPVRRRSAAGAVSLLAVAIVVSACSASSGTGPSSHDAGVRSGNGTPSASAGTDGAGGGVATGVAEMAGGGFFGIGGAMDAAVAGGQCGGQTFPLEKKPAELLLVLDRSGSMKDPPDGARDPTSKWDLTVPAVNQVVTATDAGLSWGLKTFPEGDTTSCVVTDAIDVPIANMNAANVTAAITATTPNGNGTPTGDAIKAAVKYLDSLGARGDTNQKYIVLATDGEPSCVGGAEKSQSTSRPYAVQAVADAAKAGYPTFVVGVATSKNTATQALNDLAEAGGEARSAVGADGGADAGGDGLKFYLASTKDALVTAFGTITGAVLDCRFALSSAPPDGQHVGVILGADRVSADSWQFTGLDKKTIEVTGAACDHIKSGATDSVRIVFGCPTDPIR